MVPGIVLRLAHLVVQSGHELHQRGEFGLAVRSLPRHVRSAGVRNR